MVCVTVPNLKRIWLHFGELWPKNYPKAPQNGILGCLENIWTFITWKPQTLYSWNLPWLCNSMRPFVWHKIGLPTIGGKWTWLKTPPKCHEIHKLLTLTSHKNSLKNAIKLQFFLLASLTIWLYCWIRDLGDWVPPTKRWVGGD